MANKGGKLALTVEQAKDGTLWGRIEYDGDLLTANANDEAGLIAAFQEQLQGFYDKKVAKAAFEIQYDITAVFDAIEVLNVSAIAAKAGIDSSLLRQYKTGAKKPGRKQLLKIQTAVNKTGQQLASLRLV